MNRRQLICATAGVAVVLKSGVGIAAGDRVTTSPTCALLPISVSQRAQGAAISQLRVEKFLPAQMDAAVLARWDFNLVVMSDSGIAKMIYAWQLRRSASGLSMPANSLRMRFPTGTRIAAMSAVQRRLPGRVAQTSNWAESLPNGTLMVLTTSRSSTSAPPTMADLRFDATLREIYLADGSRRDFDALLIETT